jgi:hypothetical protein
MYFKTSIIAMGENPDFSDKKTLEKNTVAID